MSTTRTDISMRAHTWDEKKHNPTGWWMSEKLDGFRCLWNGTTLLSRYGNRIHAPHWWTEKLPKDVKLDGELFMGRGKFQLLSSIVKRTVNYKPDAWTTIAYMVFDCPTSGTWIERFRIDPTVIGYPVMPCMHYECKGVLNLNEFYRSIVDNGGEGVMLRNPNGLWEVRRSWNILKVKPELQTIGRIVGYTKGEGKYEGMIGALICSVAGRPDTTVGSGLSDSDRSFHNTSFLIGDMVGITYQCLTDSGELRFPRLSKL